MEACIRAHVFADLLTHKTRVAVGCAGEKENPENSRENKLNEPDLKLSPVNIVFIGHVDAGKSTICGNILLLTNKIERRLIETYEQEAKDKGRDSW